MYGGFLLITTVILVPLCTLFLNFNNVLCVCVCVCVPMGPEAEGHLFPAF